MATLRLVGALVLALLAVPLASAGAASGTLEATKVHLLGPATMEAPSASLRWEGVGAPGLELTAEGMTVERLGSSTQRVGAAFQMESKPVRERVTHAASSLRLEAGQGDSLLAARVGSIAATVNDADIRGIGHAMLATRRPADACVTDLPDPFCMDARGVIGIITTTTDAALAGDLTFLLYGPTVVVQEGGKSTQYTSGGTSTTENGVTRTDDVWVLVTLTAAHGTLASTTGGATWYTAEPTLRAQAAGLEGATGRFDVGTKAYVARAEVVDITGAITLEAGPVAASEPSRADPKTGQHPTAYASAIALRVSGDIGSVSLAAMPIYQSSPVVATGFLALFAATLGALAYYWPLVYFQGAAFYTRLKQPEILDNEVRNAIYEIIRTNPGISAREAHRRTEQSWGTVAYHLRQLERHHLVVSRSVGRTRNYYENHGKYRGMEVQLACLQSSRARVLARLVLDQPGISQEELALKGDMPQPTTSYYVRKLKAANLVQERRDGRYARYDPVGDLARFVELAEQSATQSTVGASSGAQA